MTLRDDLRVLFSGPARYRARSPWGPLSAGLAVVLVVTAAIVIVILGSVVIIVASGVDAEALRAELRPESVLTSPLGLAIVMAVHLVILVGVWLLAGRANMRPEVLQFAAPAPGFLVCVLAGLAIVAVSTVLETVLRVGFGVDFTEDGAMFTEALRSPTWPAIVFFGAVVAPLWEEVVFRGFLLSAFAQTRLGIVGGGLLSNTIWTLFHYPYSAGALASVFLAGAILTWLLWRTGSLRIAIVAHAVNNAVAFALFYVFAPVPQ